MNRGIHTLILACFIFSSVDAQVHPRDSIHFNRNSIYLELAGLGIVYSINYDHIFILDKEPELDSAHKGLGLRVGIAAYKPIFSDDYYYIIAIPLEGYFTFGNIFNLELGVSNTIFYDEESGTSNQQAIRVGGKYRGRQGLILFLGGNLMYDGYSDPGGIYPFPYLGFGLSF
jgi:hypothetical protein